MMVIFHVVDLMGIVVLSFDKIFLVKEPLMFSLILTMIGCPALNLKEEMKVVLHWLYLCVLKVGRNIMVISQLTSIDALVAKKVDTI